MDPQRQGEIALAYLKYIIRNHGITLKPSSQKELQSFSEDSGIPMSELMEMSKLLIDDAVQTTFR